MRCAIIEREILVDFELHHNEITLVFEQFHQQVEAHGNKKGVALVLALKQYLDSISDNVSKVLLSVHKTIFGEVNQSTSTHDKLVDVLKRVVASGPSPDAPANLLMFDKSCVIDILPGFDAHTGESVCSFNPFEDVTSDAGVGTDTDTDATVLNANVLYEVLYQRIATPLVLGFHHCCTAGHLMQEPVHGVIFIVERLEVSTKMFDVNHGDADGDGDSATVIPQFVESCLSCPSPGSVVPLITTTNTTINTFESGLFISEMTDLCRNMHVNCNAMHLCLVIYMVYYLKEEVLLLRRL